MVMDALLHNKEEVDLSVLYVDPVHDFAILRYDPDAIKYQKLSEVSACLVACLRAAPQQMAEEAPPTFSLSYRTFDCLPAPTDRARS